MEENTLQRLLEDNNRAEEKLKDLVKTDELLRKAYKSNHLGISLLKGELYEKSAKLFQKAIEYYGEAREELKLEKPREFTNAYFNLGKALAGAKKYKEATEQYEKCISASPFLGIAKSTLGEYKDACKHTLSCHFNSYECMVEAYSELAINYHKIDQPEAAYKNAMRALELEPGKSEVIKTLGNVLRQMNRKQEAIDLVWDFVATQMKNFHRPSPIDCKAYKCSEPPSSLHIVCVKYGTLYGADYVNKLYRGVEKFLNISHDFVCFTDNPSGLEEEIKVVKIDNKFGGWWSKANIFNSDSNSLAYHSRA
eukprot:TRINITY_DN8713_c0_g1_i11.p1 TRINITY_DN8713_c0_g1~~TRINITY_DN8713_c0_g1_i11.p1  ORF type:complete len:309 (-),score=67.61 TRINITY_DN8713_c0_g1_i11:274-1200(-)